jgi:acetoin:2,6-dichlorophenolindophenol oxidoreductase subunit beta
MPQITYREAITAALREAMHADARVCVIGEDVSGGAGCATGRQDSVGGAFGVTKGLLTEFGALRVLDAPISETAFVGAAIGASLAGLRPVVDLMFADFAGVCFDQIFNQAAKIRYMSGGKASVPIVIRMAIGAGLTAAAQHSQTLYPQLSGVPGLKCVVPSSAYDAKGLLASAIADDDPVMFLEHKALYSTQCEVPVEPYRIPLGRAAVVREGSDVSIVTLGAMVHVAMAAANSLASQGVSCEIVDLRTTSPLDEASVLETVRRTGRAVVLDEAPPRCGIASDVAAVVAERAFTSLRAAVVRITAPHAPVPFSPLLEKLYLPDAERVCAAVTHLMKQDR